jgi:FtsZ-binding cell division protein ZapB
VALEFLSELENKVDSLIEMVYNLKKEKELLVNEHAQNASRLKELEKENSAIKKEMESLRGDTEKRLNQMNVASEKIQALLKKLEAVG